MAFSNQVILATIPKTGVIFEILRFINNRGGVTGASPADI